MIGPKDIIGYNDLQFYSQILNSLLPWYPQLQGCMFLFWGQLIFSKRRFPTRYPAWCLQRGGSQGFRIFIDSQTSCNVYLIFNSKQIAFPPVIKRVLCKLLIVFLAGAYLFRKVSTPFKCLLHLFLTALTSPAKFDFNHTAFIFRWYFFIFPF